MQPFCKTKDDSAASLSSRRVPWCPQAWITRQLDHQLSSRVSESSLFQFWSFLIRLKQDNTTLDNACHVVVWILWWAVSKPCRQFAIEEHIPFVHGPCFVLCNFEWVVWTHLKWPCCLWKYYAPHGWYRQLSWTGCAFRISATHYRSVYHDRKLSRLRAIISNRSACSVSCVLISGTSKPLKLKWNLGTLEPLLLLGCKARLILACVCWSLPSTTVNTVILRTQYRWLLPSPPHSVCRRCQPLPRSHGGQHGMAGNVTRSSRERWTKQLSGAFSYKRYRSLSCTRFATPDAGPVLSMQPRRQRTKQSPHRAVGRWSCQRPRIICDPWKGLEKVVCLPFCLANPSVGTRPQQFICARHALSFASFAQGWQIFRQFGVPGGDEMRTKETIVTASDETSDERGLAWL